MHPAGGPGGCCSSCSRSARRRSLIYPLREIAPDVSPGVVYLLAVLLVAVYWGLAFGLLTSLVSAAAFNFFHIPPTGRLVIADSAHWVALGVFLVAGAVASAVADLARTRTAEAERRRGEADLAADTARVLLGGATLADALPEAGRLVGAALGLKDVEILLDPASHDERAARSRARSRRRSRGAAGAGHHGEADEALRARVRERVAPALEALLRAALDRDRLQAEVVETQALRRSDVIKTALLRAVSHDLRTPLTAIITAGARGALAGARGRRARRAGPGRRRGGATALGAGRQAARPVAAAGGRGRAAARLVLAGGGRPHRRERRLRRRRHAASRCPSTPTSRSCRPMPPSSNASSSTCWRTRGATAAAIR